MFQNIFAKYIKVYLVTCYIVYVTAGMFHYFEVFECLRICLSLARLFILEWILTLSIYFSETTLHIYNILHINSLEQLLMQLNVTILDLYEVL
jgi:uncharacterized membrane protein YhdT